MADLIGELDASIQARLDADTDFQATLEGLDDDTKTQTISDRKSEELNKEIQTLKEGSEKAAKAQELADNYKVRAEKAEKEAKGVIPSKDEVKGNLSPSDLLAVIGAKVHEDDMERVERFAKSENVTIKEALKNPELKAILDLREEQRTTANATNVTNVRRGSTQVSDETLLSDASSGKLPEDEAGIERLIAAKIKRK